MLRHRLTDHQWEIIQHLFPHLLARDDPGGIDAKSSRESSGFSGRVLPGVTCQRSSGLGQPYGILSIPGTMTERWTRSSIDCGAAGIDVGLVDRQLWCIDGTMIRAARCAGGGGKDDDPEGTLGSRPGTFSRRLLDQDPSALRRSCAIPWISI